MSYSAKKWNKMQMLYWLSDTAISKAENNTKNPNIYNWQKWLIEWLCS
jgi:hypothetical protein